MATICGIPCLEVQIRVRLNQWLGVEAVIAHRKYSPSKKAHNVIYTFTQFTRSPSPAQRWLFSHSQQPTTTPPPQKDLEYYLCVAANKGHAVCVQLLLDAQVTATGNHTVLLRNDGSVMVLHLRCVRKIPKPAFLLTPDEPVAVMQGPSE